MKTIKVSEATDAALNWLVAKCEGLIFEDDTYILVLNDEGRCLYSTDWNIGGPIIYRESISLVSPSATLTMFWTADIGTDRKFTQWDHDPLRAAMRCFVVSELGYTVEVPDEL